jgi:hypothetical protein
VVFVKRTNPRIVKAKAQKRMIESCIGKILSEEGLMYFNDTYTRRARGIIAETKKDIFI